MNVSFVSLFLVTLIFLGVISQNNSITISATVLLLMQQTALVQFVPLVEKHGLNIGIIFLTVGVLSPLVSGRVQVPPVAENNSQCSDRYFCGLAGRTWCIFNGATAGVGGRSVNRHGYRGCVYGRYSCWPADCSRHLVFCRRKGLKSPFSFWLAIVQWIERMPPKRKIQVRFLLARFNDLY